jgi:hypothetical protein
MKTLAPRAGALKTMLFASLLSIAAAQARSPNLIGDGLSLTDDPDSPYYLGEIAPPSWQGRRYAIRNHGAPQ